ncbi:MAG: hypothetical protein M3R00_03165 [Pseudomonadota bacterium]|nr:hypothetical protein [Pseudomonadota bacterium]
MMLQRILILSVVLLAGCGFQLRGQNVLPPALYQMSVHTNAPYNRFAKTLKQRLILLGVQPSLGNRTLLSVKEEKLAEREVTIDTTNQVKVYTYTYSITYSLTVNGKLLIDNRNISMARPLMLAPSARTETDNQRDFIVQELERNVVSQLINQLHSTPIGPRQ